MFNSISGTITEKTASSIFIETGGIEWDIMVPALSLDAFGTVGSAARAFIWLYHREDQMRLFGFSSARERELFLDLMKVEGIGPKQAIKILSSITVPELEKALDGEDLARLESAPGIGKKTAQKMILALKGKLTHVDDTRGRRAGERKTEHEDIVTALAGMGFDRKAAIDAVENAAADIRSTADGSVPANVRDIEQEIFRRAIVALSS
jgi:Holliday junction DNA helicase RuvA